MLSFEVDVRPQLTMLGNAGDAISDGISKGVQEAAEVGADWVDERLNRVLRKQTPYYRLQITTKPDGPNWKITDGGVIYGPWLENGGRRRTRFRGYNTFRIIRQRLAQQAYVFVERNVMVAVRKVMG